MGIKLSDERCEEIKQIVVDLFDKYDINCIPISGFEIANKMGIKVIPYSAKSDKTRNLCLQFSEDGFSVLKNEKWTIFYNDEKQYGRFNNTIVHEIGHIVLNHTEDIEQIFNVSYEAAVYALVYYKKWLNYGGKFYTSYEEKLLSMFNKSILKLKIS